MRYCSKIKYLVLALLLWMPYFACTLIDQATTGVPSIVINEVVTSNGQSHLDEVHGSPDWIELKNIGKSRASLLGFRITDNVQNGEKAFTLPDTVLEPGQFVLLYANKEKTDTLAYESGAICIGFSLKATGETITLLDDKMQIIQELIVPEMDRDISYARKADGIYGFCAQPTPNEENTTEITETLAGAKQLRGDADRPVYPPQEGIVFSEVSARNNEVLTCTGCLGCDWVELHNLTNADISLAGFALTDDESDYDKPNLDTVLPAGGYLVIRCCKDECDTSDGHLCVLMGISRYGDHLYLFDSHEMLCAEIEIPETPEKDVAYMRCEDGAYRFTSTATPGEPNVYDAYVPKPTDAPEPVFTGLNSRVIISEALPNNRYSLADRDGDRSDWVELYNPGDSDVTLLGWYLSDSKDFQKWAFPDVTIPAKGYLLVFLSGKENMEGELHASFSLSEGEKLRLYCASDNTYDALEIPAARDNVSIGRDVNGKIVYYGEPTPLAPNGHARPEADLFGFFQSDAVFISEVCAAHKRGSGEKDWIELFNGGTESAVLDGCYLTDDIDRPTKYRIDSLTVAPKGYAVISVSKFDGNFSVSPTGETLFLIGSNGTSVLDVFETGITRSGGTSGRLENDPAVRRVFFEKPTPGAANDSAYSVGYTSMPLFSQTGLYHTDPFTLTLTTLTPDATIYYTTDGSEPTRASRTYNGPILIEKSGVVRAFAASDGLLDSDPVSYTYLFEEPHTVPVVCISMAPEDFKKVYSVREHKNIVAKKGYINYYESDGLIGTSFPCDIKAKGQGTLTYISQKSLTITLRAEYGKKTVEYPFFSDYAVTEFSSFAMRNAGQDYSGARMRDAYISRACLGMNVEVANSRPVVLYVNGAYYGLYDFNEDLNSRFIESHYGVDSDTVNIIRRNGHIANKGTTTEWKKVFNEAKSINLASDAAYEKFCEKVDPDYFIDYVIARTFVGDGDMFNQKYWRSEDYTIRWRPILYDLDLGLGANAKNRNMMHNYFDYGGTPSRNGSLTYFYISCALKTNESFRKKFVERYVELVMTQFTPERLTALADQMEAEYEPEMARHIARWKHPSSVSAWKKEVDALRKTAVYRSGIILEQVQKEFRVSKEEMDALIAKYSTTAP